MALTAPLAPSTMDDVAAALVAAGVASATGGTDWFVWKGFMPDGDNPGAPGGNDPTIPDRAFCLYEPPGQAPIERGLLIYPSIQLKGRGAPATTTELSGYAELRAMMDQAFSVLHQGEAAIGAAYVYCLAAHTGCIPMGFDNRRRPALAMNFRLCKRTL